MVGRDGTVVVVTNIIVNAVRASRFRDSNVYSGITTSTTLADTDADTETDTKAVTAATATATATALGQCRTTQC